MAKSYEEPLATAKELAKRTDISPFVRMAMIFQACRNSSAAFLKIQSDAGNGVQENAFLHNKYINYLITELKPVTGEIIRQEQLRDLSCANSLMRLQRLCFSCSS